MLSHADYRDLIAAYIARQFGPHGLQVSTNVSLGREIVGKSQRIDVFVLRASDQQALAISCQYPDIAVPRVVQELEALWMPGCLVYAGEGWSQDVLHALESSKLAAYCWPERPELARTPSTLELDQFITSVFGLPEHEAQLSLPLPNTDSRA